MPVLGSVQRLRAAALAVFDLTATVLASPAAAAAAVRVFRRQRWGDIWNEARTQ
jgi:hypothetical protein